MSTAGRLRGGVGLALAALLGCGACSGPEGAGAGSRGAAAGPSAASTAPTTAPTAGLTTGPTAGPTADERARIAGDLLRRRASAYVRHDPGALRALLLDPGSAWGRSEVAALQVLARLPVERLSVGTVRTSELTRGPSGTAFVATAPTSYRFAGFDTGDRTVDLGFTIRKGPDGWRIAGPDDSEGGATARLPWELPGAQVRRTARTLVVGSVDDAEMTRVSQRAERAVDVVAGVWTAPWPHRLVVLAPATEPDYRGLLRSPGDAGAQVAAVTDGGTGADGLAHADRVVLDPTAMASLQPDGRSVVVAHEALHVAMRASVRGRVPLWVSEGYAEVAGYRAPVRRLAPGRVVGALREQVTRTGLPATLPADADFATSADSLAPAYNGAWVAMTLLLERLGPARLTTFASTAATTGPDAAVGEATARALRAEAGTDLAAFTSQWRARVSALTR